MNGIPVTKTTLAALRWFAEHEPVSLFPLDGTAPSSVMRKRLRTAGWIEDAGKPGRFGFMSFQLSETGRQILETGKTT